MSEKLEMANEFADIYKKLQTEIGKVIVGQHDAVEAVLISLFSNGHCLLIGVPGLAKTLLIKTMSEALDLTFNRVQFTPDLMPSDIVGSEILDENRKFKFLKGPVFANIVLADEINRTPPKTQAALLEAMQEKSVTVGGVSHQLPNPFFVLATQNPIEQEGTYPLPEAQLDRFMFNIMLTYPSFEDEVRIVRETTSDISAQPQKVINAIQILAYQKLIRQIPVTQNVLEYAVNMASKTRPGTDKATPMINDYVSYGAGPRAGQFLITGARCYALMHGKISPDIEDVQAVADKVLRHRIVRNYKAESNGVSIEEIIKGLY